MKIWVDADACPVAIRDIITRAAKRTATNVCFIANHPLPIAPSPWVASRVVSQGFDIADNEIVQLAQPLDLVITQDIPLAAEVIAKGCLVINPRGEQWSADNIRQRLNLRDFMETMRSSGVQSGGPPPLNKQDKMKFANALDRLLAKYAANPQ